jgi:hypothetical protein
VELDSESSKDTRQLQRRSRNRPAGGNLGGMSQICGQFGITNGVSGRRRAPHQSGRIHSSGSLTGSQKDRNTLVRLARIPARPSLKLVCVGGAGQDSAAHLAPLATTCHEGLFISKSSITPCFKPCKSYRSSTRTSGSQLVPAQVRICPDLKQPERTSALIRALNELRRRVQCCGPEHITKLILALFRVGTCCFSLAPRHRLT